MRHIHQLGASCAVCGYIAIPARFYAREGKSELPYEEALGAFREWAREARPDLYDSIKGEIRVVTEKGPVTDDVTEVVTEKICYTCSEGFTGYGKNCNRCRVKKSRAMGARGEEPKYGRIRG